jgi:meiotically up-regulated gene 157 (Mug157) protein
VNLLTRRSILQGFAATGVAAALPASLAALIPDLSAGRPNAADRRFSSPAIEDVIARMKQQIADPMLSMMFERCFPNTLDTTVFPETLEDKPDTFVITGDIDAMWLRDSSAQVWPYVQFATKDPRLAALLEGVIRRHARMILIDPYANAFTRTPSDPPLKWAVDDATHMAPGVAERKWEIDSLCHVVRLAYGYWQTTGSTAPFDAQWKDAAWAIVRTFREQQRLTGPGPYAFKRKTQAPTDTLPLNGYGNPARPVGMIFSMFRPSDDACIYPLFVPANHFAVQTLIKLRKMAIDLFSDTGLAAAASEILTKLQPALAQHGMVQHPTFGKIWAYEVDGYGNALMMDDAGAPSLLSLPYLGSCDNNDPVYQRTRRFAQSTDNPYFVNGTAAEGIGSPHAGLHSVWPLSLIMRALTSSDDREILQCLHWLRDTTAGTGFMHESFNQNDPSKFTRKWFAWANTQFGELLLKLADQKPSLLKHRYENS